MLQIHPNARTTPVTRAEIARSHERTGVLAQLRRRPKTNESLGAARPNISRGEIPVRTSTA
jgi:hypothetical protein